MKVQSEREILQLFLVGVIEGKRIIDATAVQPLLFRECAKLGEGPIVDKQVLSYLLRGMTRTLYSLFQSFKWSQEGRL